MTDAEKELRRLAQEAQPGPWFSKVTVLALLDRIEVLEKKTEITIGVGGGAGNLFVHGDHESVAHLQKMLLKASGLEVGLGGRLREAERKGAEEMRKAVVIRLRETSLGLDVVGRMTQDYDLKHNLYDRSTGYSEAADDTEALPLPGDAA